MLHSTIILLGIAAEIIIGYNLVFPLILFLIARAGNKHTGSTHTVHGRVYDYAIIVTAYEQTDSLHAVVDSILKSNYQHYIVYIVADKCDTSQLEFTDPRIVLLRPEETLASNTRSHFYAITHFIRPHDVLTIIDSDNLVDPQYLDELNNTFDKGFDAIQGLRTAKNLETTFARLDAARDIYYHFYDGLVLFSAGSSATLAGSGMAFKTALYRECLENLDITGAGFDKVLQREIVARGFRIAFNGHAIVYDEKTSHSSQLIRQRARWINTWFRYSGYGFSLVKDGCMNRDINKLLFGIVLLRPPLFMLIIASVTLLVSNAWLSIVGFTLWMTAFTCFLAGFAVALYHSKPDKRIIRSLAGIPRFMWCQCIALIRTRKANKISVATTHYNSTTIKDIVK
jgi:cellulose synthase/poly-beta-1,6-N-acetylglucosamine synthase-like glycosyltransferase